MLKIRWSRDRLIFNMEIPYLGKTVFTLKRCPGSSSGSLRLISQYYSLALTHRNDLYIIKSSKLVPVSLSHKNLPQYHLRTTTKLVVDRALPALLVASQATLPLSSKSTLVQTSLQIPVSGS